MRKEATPVRVEFVARGRGAVELVVRNVGGPGIDLEACTLCYPEQGRMIGSLPVDVDNARALDLAAEELNLTLARLCS